MKLKPIHYVIILAAIGLVYMIFFSPKTSGGKQTESEEMIAKLKSDGKELEARLIPVEKKMKDLMAQGEAAIIAKNTQLVEQIKDQLQKMKESTQPLKDKFYSIVARLKALGSDL